MKTLFAHPAIYDRLRFDLEQRTTQLPNVSEVGMQLYGITLHPDPELPINTAEYRDASGSVLQRIIVAH